MIHIIEKFGLPLVITPSDRIIFDGRYYAVVWIK